MKKAFLEEVLAFREKRVFHREELLSEYHYPIACLGLNIPGEYKDFPWARRAFHEEIESFAVSLAAEGIAVSHSEAEEGSYGYTAYISADVEAPVLKALALRMEETHPLGRLFDIDIYDSRGEKLSREDSGAPQRPCLVCGGNGFACARSRAHLSGEVRVAVLHIIENWLRQTAGEKACTAAAWAIMSEAAVTPKPGLVDRANSGAHRDMDFFSFIDSASELLPWFRSCAITGFNSAAENEGNLLSDPQALFESLRPQGRVAEVLMKNAAGGVNVHRGYIFSLGLLSAAYGRFFRNSEKPDLAEMMEFIKTMTAKLKEDFSAPQSKTKELSHGEAVYAKTGIKGIRGEVSGGFPSVTGYALPLLRSMLKSGFSLNDAGIAVLLKLLSRAEDTNIVHRGGAAALAAVQGELKSFFEAMTEPLNNSAVEAMREKAAALDAEFISKNVSPGGCADLLGVTLFLHRLF